LKVLQPYKDIVEGRQKLGRAFIYKFSSAMNHSKKEAEYFENMFFFNESTSADEGMLYFERMISCQKTSATNIDVIKYEYYTKWYYSAIRALISLGRFSDNDKCYKKIDSILNPRIQPDEVKKCSFAFGSSWFHLQR